MISPRLFLGFLIAAFTCWGADTGAAPVYAENGRVRPITVGPSDLIVPQFVDGDTWQTTLILTNLGTATAYYRAFFLSDAGVPLVLDFVGLGRASSISGQLGPGQSTELATVGTAATLSQGWVSIFNYDRPPSEAGAVVLPNKTGGMAIFRRRLPGLPDQEAVVPISSAFDKTFTIPFDNRNGFLSGIALANGGTQNGVVTVTARDNAGSVLLTDSFQLNSFVKVVYQVPIKYPALAGKAGILQYSINNAGFSGLGLRFNPTGSFTSTHPLTLAQ